MVASGGSALLATPPTADLIREATWIDLSSPLDSERESVEAALGIKLPSKSDMSAIEASSRVYREADAQVMNILVVVGVDSGTPNAVPVSLILLADKLVTVRYADPLAFRTLDAQCTRFAAGPSAPHLLIQLLDNIVDRTADILEMTAAEIDNQSAHIFGHDAPRGRRLSTSDLNAILTRLGNTRFVLGKVHESLVTMARAAGFLSVGAAPDIEALAKPRNGKKLREAMKPIIRDIQSLSENSAYLSQTNAFLLDAALGRISIEQNSIIKIFSVAAVVFLPPTLVASIYGMNFQHMPELEWLAGYPFALGAMILSAILPYLWFKHKGWL